MSGRRIGRKEALWLSLFVLAAFFIKVGFMLPEKYGPLILNDEAQYIETARWVWDRTGEVVSKYPPVTALTLVPGYLFGENWYLAMLIIGTLLGTLSLVPVYLTMRLFVSPAKAALTLGVCFLTPFHWLFPRMAMSENPYMLLFFFAVYLVLRDPPKKHPLLWEGMIGVCLALTLLTRYITLVTLPVFWLLWWLRPAAPGRGALRARVAGFLALCGAMVLTWLPWLAMGIVEDVPVKTLLGFSIASKTDPAKLTPARFLEYFWMYAGYFLAMAGPMAGVLMAGIKLLKQPRQRQGRLFLLVLLLVLAFGAAVTRHSYRVYYNLDGPTKLMGRYLIPFSALFPMTFMAAFEGLGGEGGKGRGAFFKSMLFQAVPLALGLAAYLFYRGPGAALVNLRGSGDVYRIASAPAIPYLIATGAGLLVLCALRFWKNLRMAPIAAALVLMLWQGVGLPGYVAGIRYFEWQAFHAAQLSQVMPERREGNAPAVVVSGVPQISTPSEATQLENALAFSKRLYRGGESVKIVKAPEPPQGETYLLCPEGESPPTGYEKMLDYELGGRRYEVYAGGEADGGAD